MVVGLIGALAQRDFRRVLSFNLIGHLGYTTVGLALMTQAAMAGSILYILHHIFVITNLYLVSGIFLRLRRTTAFEMLGSLYRDYPGVAVIVDDSDLFAFRITAAIGIYRKAVAGAGVFRSPRFLDRRTHFIRGRIDAHLHGASVGRVVLEACPETRSIIHEPLDGGSDRVP